MKQRTIKFRCWDKELKCMLEMEVKEKQIWFGDVNVFSEILLNHNRFIIMQFIGLFDKNKKPIYEGDIVSIHEKIYYIIYEISTMSYHIVFKSGTSYQYERYLGDKGYSRLEFHEIIGNVWENPDLLNNKEGVG